MEELMKSPVLLLQSLLTDVRRLCPEVKGLDRDLITIEKRFENEGYGFLTIALPALGDALTQGIHTGRFTRPSGFKSSRGAAIPRFLSGMLCEVFDPLTGELKDTADKGLIKCLREVLYVFKKTQMPSEDEVVLHKKAVAEFFRCDDAAAKVILPERNDHLIGIVSRLVLSGLSSVPLDEIQFKHGPGAVYEGLKANQKWLALTNSVKNEEFDVHSYGYADFGVNLSELSERTETSVSKDASFCSFGGASSSTARLITVPKNSTSRRTITVEPMLNQFVQQGLNIVLRDNISRCPVLSNCLALTDQSKNQQLALEGSLTGKWATIDLKSASDLLSVKLVESVFRHHGLFFDHMMDCRSTRIDSDIMSGQILAKFAGMVNALTFPVQSTCFAVVCIAAILDQWGLKPTHLRVKRAARQIRVFGDDIIVNSEFALQCVNWLEAVGLKINRNKSFLEGNFRESCGVDAFKGVDVTPLYVRSRPDDESTEPNAIGGLVATSNLAWMRGLYEFSAELMREVEERLGYSLPLVAKDCGALGWHSRLDAMTPTRWNHNLQAFETRTLVLKPLKRRDRLDGYAALLKFFHVPLLGRGRDHLKESPIRYKLRIGLTWVPTLVS
jgi:hypothetical protein